MIEPLYPQQLTKAVLLKLRLPEEESGMLARAFDSLILWASVNADDISKQAPKAERIKLFTEKANSCVEHFGR